MSFIGCQRSALRPVHPFNHQHGGISQRSAVTLQQLRVHDQSVPVLDHDVAAYANFASCPVLLCARRASESVVDWRVSLRRFSPWKFTVEFPGSSGAWRRLVPALKAFLARPGFDQRAVYTEMLVR
jgi:hypothetical protein